MKTPNVIKTPTTEYKISQDVPLASQTWRERLALVSSLPNRFVGIIETPPKNGEPFTMYGTMLYIAELMFAPVTEMMEGPKGEKVPVMGPDGRPKIIGLHGSTKLHAMVPYDFLGLPEIEITSAQHIIWIAKQPEEFREWMYQQYLHHFDPPRIQRV